MVKSMNAWAICNCQPDITFFLQVSTEEGLARLAKRGEALDPIELESNNFHQKIQEGYLFLAKNEPQRFIVLAGNQSIDTLAAAILETVMKKIAKKGEND
jgi:dTMP kinase